MAQISVRHLASIAGPAVRKGTHLEGEIHVTGGVDDVDEVVLPAACCCSRGDGDPPLLLLGHPIHGGRALMHLPNLRAPGPPSGKRNGSLSPRACDTMPFWELWEHPYIKAAPPYRSYALRIHLCSLLLGVTVFMVNCQKIVSERS